MIYDLSLQAGGFVTGIVLILLSVPGLVKPGPVQNWLKRFPRSGIAGVVLLTLTLVWSFWLLATMEMGEFSSFRRPLMVVLPIGYVLVLRFVEEFLAVRALGILCLLAAEPLLEAAFSDTTYANGETGQAFSMDGAGDGVVIGNPANLQLQNFTIEAWIKRASSTKASLGPY